MTAKSPEFRDLVKSVRKQMKLSQEDLAREPGVSFATINRWENGKVKPSKLARRNLTISARRSRSADY